MRFSLIIPVAPERDAGIIESIKNLKYPKSEFHVIVVRGKNPSENRNKGVEKAIGEILVFLDDDAIVDKNLLKQADRFFKQYPEIDIVGGPQLTPIDEKGFSKISGYALSSIFGAWKIANRYSGKEMNLNADETMLTSANLFCKKKVFEKIKFNPLLFPGEDPDFICKAEKIGFKIAYFPGIIVYHKRRASLKKLAKQIYNYGVTRPKKESLKDSIKKPFFLIPSLFLIYLVFLSVFLVFNTAITGGVTGFQTKEISFLLFLPLILYLIINLLFSMNNALINRDLSALWNLPYIYFIIHMSYGFGFLKSTLKNIFGKGENNLNAPI